jgi:hypothetical protein
MLVSYLCTPVKCTAVSTLYLFFHLSCTIKSQKDSQVGRYNYLNSMLYIISRGSAHMQQDVLSNSCTAAETLYYLIPVLLLDCDAIDQ